MSIRRRASTLERLLRARLWGLRRGVSVGRRARVGRRCRLIMEPSATVVIGERSEIDDGSTLAAYGRATVTLGDRSFVGHHCTIAARERVTIGEGTFLAELVSVRDHDHDVSSPPSSGRVRVGPVDIGRDVWLAAKVTVVRGVDIGDRVVVGANAVVTKSLAAGEVATGIPARPRMDT